MHCLEPRTFSSFGILYIFWPSSLQSTPNFLFQKFGLTNADLFPREIGDRDNRDTQNRKFDLGLPTLLYASTGRCGRRGGWADGGGPAAGDDEHVGHETTTTAAAKCQSFVLVLV